MIINLPYFSDINSDSLIDYYNVNADIQDQTIQLDINFKETSIEYSRLLILKDYLEDISKIIEIAKNEIFFNFESEDDVNEFLTFHIEELDQNDLDSLVKTADKGLSIEEQLLSLIKLKRIGFYPYDHNEFAILDFTLNEDISQYLLVVKMKDSKIVDHITMES